MKSDCVETWNIKCLEESRKKEEEEEETKQKNIFLCRTLQEKYNDYQYTKLRMNDFSRDSKT